MASLQEKVVLQSHASEEQRSLHQVISQSAGDLGRGRPGWEWTQLSSAIGTVEIGFLNLHPNLNASSSSVLY